jgi:hypothetical protein
MQGEGAVRALVHRAHRAPWPLQLCMQQTCCPTAQQARRAIARFWSPQGVCPRTLAHFCTRTWSRDAAGARHRQLAAAAQRNARHGGHDRLGACLHELAERAIDATAEICAGRLVRELLDVEAAEQVLQHCRDT